MSRMLSGVCACLCLSDEKLELIKQIERERDASVKIKHPIVFGNADKMRLSTLLPSPLSPWLLAVAQTYNSIQFDSYDMAHFFRLDVIEKETKRESVCEQADRRIGKKSDSIHVYMFIFHTHTD